MPVGQARVTIAVSQPLRPDTLSRSRLRLVVGALILASAIPVIVAPIIPAIDFYNHLARYYVLANNLTDESIARNYLINWRLLPNIGFDLIGTAALRFLPVELAAKFLILTIFAAQTLGVWTCAKALGSPRPALNVLLSLPLLFSYVLIWGFTNFLFAIGISLLGIAAYLSSSDRIVASIVVGNLIGSIVLLCHGFAFFLYGITLAGLLVGIGLRDGLPAARIASRLVVLACTALAPFALFLLSGTGDPAGNIPGGLSSQSLSEYAALTDRLGKELWHRIDYTVRVASTGWVSFDLLFFAATALLLTLAVRRRILGFDPTVLPALLILGAVAILCPPSLFGVGHVADRIPLVAALVGVTGFRPGSLGNGIRRFVASWGALTLVRLIVIGTIWLSYSQQRRAFDGLLATIPPRSLVLSVADLPTTSFFRQERRCEMWHPLLLPLADAVVPLFADERMQPMALSGRLLSSLKALPPGVTLPRTFVLSPMATLRGAKAAGFDYALVCGQATIRLTPDAIAWQHGDLTLVPLQGQGERNAVPPAR